MDAHNERLLKSKIKHRKEELKTKLWLAKKGIEDFEKFPDPQSAANLVAMMADVARYTQGLQDLRDVAEMPRGINLKEEGE